MTFSDGPTMADYDALVARATGLEQAVATLTAEVEALRTALERQVVHMAPDRWVACRECGAARRLADGEVDSQVLNAPLEHKPTCALARAPEPPADESCANCGDEIGDHPTGALCVRCDYEQQRARWAATDAARAGDQTP